ncbi:MAG: RNA 2'-phosphotransferase [Oscillospiraceae bacterium]|nr:RNA 2'-phosphotransferase [Oscillospiraceae bacterium]
MNNIGLSKEISYALRHAPQEYGLYLDEQGWVGIGNLISALKKQERFKLVTESDIENMIQTSEKKRHEICDGKIRALYGHSINEKILKQPIEPPDELYHGTAHKFIDSILKIGLIPKDRQYVHLSEDINTAIIVGKRRDENPVILKIDSKQAWDDGIKFYLGNENIWLSDSIPIKYISLVKNKNTY